MGNLLYRVWFVNLGYYWYEDFSSLDEAVELGRKGGFEFAIHHGRLVVASWSPISGLDVR